MERPSHIDFDSQARCFSCRMPYVVLAISLQIATVWLFIHGLIDISKVNIFHPGTIELVPVVEPKTPPTKPPEAKIPDKVKTDTVLPPHWTVKKDGGGITIVPNKTEDPPPMRGPDRVLAGIPATHTVPPYPPIARRIGAEGKVTLRLTVSAEGKVTAADIVTSSGRDDMDQGAQQWIMAHWAYKPALDKGVPTVSHTLATVIFSLVNEH